MKFLTGILFIIMYSIIYELLNLLKLIFFHQVDRKLYFQFCKNPKIFFCYRAGKPPVGLHLDVLKSDKLIQVNYFYGYLCFLQISIKLTVFIILLFRN